MIDPSTGDQEDEQWQSWYRLTSQERWRETEKLWEFYLLVGGSLDPEPDSQSPFDADFPQVPPLADNSRPDFLITKLGTIKMRQ